MNVIETKKTKTIIFVNDKVLLIQSPPIDFFIYFFNNAVGDGS